MNDKKFIILLVFITIVALVNVIWLTTLQAKVNRLRSGSVLPETKEFIEIVESIHATTKSISKDHPFFIPHLTVRSIRVVNEDIEDRIVMSAKKDSALISLIEQNHKPRIILLTEGPGKNAGINIYLNSDEEISKTQYYAGIHLTTIPELITSDIEINGTQGQKVEIVPRAIFRFNEYSELTGILKEPIN